MNHIANPDFDYFASDSHWIEIQAKDTDGLLSGQPANLTIQLLWANQAPHFPQSTYTVFIPEGLVWQVILSNSQINNTY